MTKWQLSTTIRGFEPRSTKDQTQKGDRVTYELSNKKDQVVSSGLVAVSSPWGATKIPNVKSPKENVLK